MLTVTKIPATTYMNYHDDYYYFEDDDQSFSY